MPQCVDCNRPTQGGPRCGACACVKVFTGLKLKGRKSVRREMEKD